MIYSIWF